MATRKVARKSAAKKAPVKKTPVKKAVARKAAPRKSAAPRKAAAARAPTDRLAGVSSEAVLKATGKAWEDWLGLLDKAGAMELPHKQIAALLGNKYEVPGWWSQMLAIGYEQARGLREKYEKADGFSATASRTFQVNLERLFKAWSDPSLREAWLPGAPLQVERSTDGKSMRITWTLGDSSVVVAFESKGLEKSTVHIEHSKLSGAEAVAAQKAYWQSGLDRLNAWFAAARPQ